MRRCSNFGGCDSRCLLGRWRLGRQWRGDGSKDLRRGQRRNARRNLLLDGMEKMLLTKIQLLRDAVRGLRVEQAVLAEISNFTAGNPHRVQLTGEPAVEFNPTRRTHAVIGEERGIARRAEFKPAARRSRPVRRPRRSVG